MNKISDYLSIKEAADFLGISAYTLRQWSQKGMIKAYRNPLNKYRLFIKKDLEEFLESIR